MNRFSFSGFYLIFFGIISISGCVTAPSTPVDPRMFEYGSILNLTVNAIAAPDASSKGNNFFIIPGMQNLSENDLEFMEVSRYVTNALSKKSYVRADSADNADILVRLGYGIGDPQTSSETVAISQGYSYAVGWMWFTEPPKTQTVKETTYRRNLILEAYDLKDPERKSQLWKTIVKSEGTSSDLNRILAYMIAASSEYFGTSTGMQIDLRISGRDPRVLDIWK
ncbi:MAG: DUF4136 domain-containing protein [Gammaproteobacteria bacterium]|nr:DUF4136 domain-containing protein [Gammaproteobacteria bacterium]